MAAVAIAGLFATPANAAPSQPGVTSPQGSQPGVTTTPAPETPSPAPVIEQSDYLPGYTPLYDYDETRTVDDYNAGRQQPSYQSQPTYYYETDPAPVQGPGLADESESPAPAAEPIPAPTVRRKAIVPIDTPEGTILVGANPIPYDPALLDPTFARQFSNTVQAIQADGGNLLVDNGFADAPRADRIAAGIAAGAVTGGAAGLGAGLIPGTAITAGGAAIGAGLGVAATPLLTPAVVAVGPGLFVFVPGAGALAGAGVGGLISAPIVATTTLIGAVTGGLIGGAAAGGEATVIEEPAPAPDSPALAAPPAGPSADQVPAIPAPLTSGSGSDLLAQANTAAENAAPAIELAVSDANTWIEPAKAAVQGFTSTVLEQPSVADAAAAAGPALAQAGSLLAGLLPA
ncbi:hypothetical protein HQ346_14345 [Rhodococcus sp. BP-252]|nr:hypothetical protein [Rhodococcus sp. BP-320]MBY6417600.1 hypothetical protein [Rhodococcus sp. BP-321]MBY6423452.1 hypothetical protein [Rhodococcus sp. BP-324]MBY6427624.1 hypothetical protein [Rhodococcus sp. BP-323]MBY6432788.1 hypothetical protein [Rhodococcus sp. BP-322]MBY6441596.1 hypothetical protein [Rhodococcus sp. BP-319]MBY6446582.1 hypothetical protein [Rhodococcus sp. BP-318]MBY6451381.1 hypothetical protein [Rhodococcus sp. BP-315]MBY6456157.1 hypothetical protein [Rhodoc